MPNKGTAKTKSAPKRHWYGLTLLAFMLLLVGVAYTIGTTSRREAEKLPKSYTLSVGGSRDLEGRYKPIVSSNPWRYYLQPARTGAEQMKGLSDTKSLASNKGMLFINSSVAQRCFWMKDMHYPLDILWVDDQKTVVHVEKSVSPDTYPRMYCQDAQYVIELNAGEADKSGITTGTVLRF